VAVLGIFNNKTILNTIYMEKMTQEEARKELDELVARMRPLIGELKTDPVLRARAKRAADVLRRTKYFPPPFEKPTKFYL
jgi:hypothetical protein